MKRSALAKRYARAFVDFAEDAAKAGKLADELNLFALAMEQTEDLRNVFLNPMFLNHRLPITKAVGKELGLGEKAMRCLTYITERDRMRHLAAIVEAIREILEEKENKVRAHVTTAQKLSDAHYDKIKAVMEKITGRKVNLEKEIDNSIIGGVVVRVGSVVYDGSVTSQIGHFKAELTKEN